MSVVVAHDNTMDWCAVASRIWASGGRESYDEFRYADVRCRALRDDRKLEDAGKSGHPTPPTVAPDWERQAMQAQESAIEAAFQAGWMAGGGSGDAWQMDMAYAAWKREQG